MKFSFSFSFSFSLLLLCLTAQFAWASLEVAVTVDDLPSHRDLPPNTSRDQIAEKMISALLKHKVPEPFAFINAGKVDLKNEPYKVLEMWKNAGFRFGNHTYLHEDLHKSAPDVFEKAIALNEPMLKKLSPSQDWKYFRYPFLREGETLEKRNTIRKYLKDHEYKIVQVTIDFEDWSWNSPYARCMTLKDSTKIDWLKKTYLENAVDMLGRADKISRALFQRQIPQVLLLHIGAFDAEMLDQLLTAYEAKGVKFISLTQAMRDKVYDLDPGVVGPWGSELTYQVMKSRHLKEADMGLEKYQSYPEAELEKACGT